MAISKTEIEGGKYTIVHDNGVGLHLLRNGEVWEAGNVFYGKMLIAVASELDALRSSQAQEPQPVPPVTDAKDAEITRLQGLLDLQTTETQTAEPVYHLRQYGDVTQAQMDEYAKTGDISAPVVQPEQSNTVGAALSDELLQQLWVQSGGELWVDKHIKFGRLVIAAMADNRPV